MAQLMKQDITTLLHAWGEGDQAALERLLPMVYGELRVLARHYMNRQRPGHLLQTTALVHEAYLRLVDWNQVQWKNRGHFFTVMALLMRRILVDWARAQNNLKRGEGERMLCFTDAEEPLVKQSADLVALDDALNTLAVMSPRQSRIVELRYFGGLDEEEIANAMNISTRTVRRDWTVARAWLYREVSKN
jgi:RNA polymerase sigma-70 factor (ECF subfamily)